MPDEGEGYQAVSEQDSTLAQQHTPHPLPTLSLPLPPMGEALSQAETQHSAEGEPLWSVTALLVHISSHFMLYEHQTETVNVF